MEGRQSSHDEKSLLRVSEAGQRRDNGFPGDLPEMRRKMRGRWRLEGGVASGPM